MKEQDLLKFSLVISLLGLFLLAIYSAKLVKEEKDIVDLRGIETGKTVKVSGVVKTIKQSDKSTTLEIQQNISTKLIVFETIEVISKGDSIRAEGKIDENNGNMQIMVEKISKI